MFKNMLTLTDWTPVFEQETVDGKTLAFNSILEGLLNACFPYKAITVKDSDQPWFNNQIRKAIKKRKKHFKKYGRDERWHELKKKSERLIDEAKLKYYEEGREKAKKDNNSARYYRVILRF